MRGPVFAWCCLVAFVSCTNATEPEPNLILELDRASYVAVDDPDPRFDYQVSVIVKFRNETTGVVRINRCTATSAFPPYLVESEGGGVPAWNPDIACASNAPLIADVPSGHERTDTLVLRAPWQRLFNGQPVGDVEGTFVLAYELQICGTVTRFGACFIANRYDFATSNQFTITIP
jgi:hypothetical protein